MAYGPWSIRRMDARVWLSLLLILPVAGALVANREVIDRYFTTTRTNSQADIYVAPLPPNAQSNPIRIALKPAEIPFDTSQARLARLGIVERVVDNAVKGEAGNIAAEPSVKKETGSDAIGNAIVNAQRSPAVAPKAEPSALKKIAGIDVMDVRFDLGGNRSSDTLELSKPMVLNGKAVGKAVIKIEGATQIFLRSDAVNLVIAKAPTGTDINKLASLSEQFAFVSWQRLRETGIDVRYDPIHDRILVKSLTS